MSVPGAVELGILQQSFSVQVLVKNPNNNRGQRCVEYRVQHTAPFGDGRRQSVTCKENIPINKVIISGVSQ